MDEGRLDGDVWRLRSGETPRSGRARRPRSPGTAPRSSWSSTSRRATGTTSCSCSRGAATPPRRRFRHGPGARPRRCGPSACLSSSTWRRPAKRSHAVAVMHGLTSASGAMVAAATTSLPERAREGRNYDYRYAWIRDQCYAGQAAAAAGRREHPRRRRSRRLRPSARARAEPAAGVRRRRRPGARRAASRAARVPGRMRRRGKPRERPVPARLLRRGAPAARGRRAARPPRRRRPAGGGRRCRCDLAGGTASPTPACGSSTRRGGRTAG